MNISKHIKEHDALGIYGSGEYVLTVGDGGQFSTLQAAIDAITLSDTYSSTAGTGTITTLAIDTRTITGSGTAFYTEFYSGNDNYMLIAGDTKAYKVSVTQSDTSAELSVSRAEASVSGTPAFSLITPTPVIIRLQSNLSTGGTITGALGFIKIDFNGFSIDEPLYNQLESGKLWLSNWDGIGKTSNPSGLDGYGYLSALTSAIGSGRGPADAVCDYELLNCNLRSSDLDEHDVIFVASSGDWDIINTTIRAGRYDTFRTGAKGVVRSFNSTIEAGSTAGNAAGGFKHDLGGVLNGSRDSVENRAIHKNAHVIVWANVSTSCFISVQTIADEEYHNCVFEVRDGLAGVIGNVSNGGYITSGTIGAAANSLTLDFYNCDIIHGDGVTEGGYAAGCGVATFGQTLTLRFHNSDVFPGVMSSSFGWTFAAEHYGSRGGQVAVGAADKTAQMQHCGKTFVFDCTAANRTLTLPPAAWCKYGRMTAIKSDGGANQLIIDGSGAETIDGAATVNTTTAYGSITVESDGTSWNIVNSK